MPLLTSQLFAVEMIDAEIGGGTFESWILAGIPTRVNAGRDAETGGPAPGRGCESVRAVGIRLAIAVAFPEGTTTLLPSRGVETLDDPAIASPLSAPATAT